MMFVMWHHCFNEVHPVNGFTHPSSAIKQRSVNWRLATGRQGHRSRFARLSSSASLPEIEEILLPMTSYVSSMVDPTTHRFYSLSRPPTNEFIHQHCPIRDLAAAWDATTLLEFLKKKENMFNDNALQENQIQILQKGVATTLAAYNQGICQVTHNNIEGPPVSLIDSQFLQEQSTIGHSAFFILATLGMEKDSSSTVGNSRMQTGNDGVVDSLVRGILSMQRPKDGAFTI